MKTRIAIILAAAILAALLFGWAPKQVNASDDCLVVSATPDSQGGATVVFNCGLSILTIHEPKWP